MKRGEVYLADLTPRSGSEQQGRQPVIVLSHDVFNRASMWRSVIVIPISSSPRQAARGPTVVPLPKGTAGLVQDSVAVCHQVTTLDRGKLTQRLGELPPILLAAVEVSLKAAVDLKSDGHRFSFCISTLWREHHLVGACWALSFSRHSAA